MVRYLLLGIAALVLAWWLLNTGDAPVDPASVGRDGDVATAGESGDDLDTPVPNATTERDDLSAPAESTVDEEPRVEAEPEEERPPAPELGDHDLLIEAYVDGAPKSGALVMLVETRNNWLMPDFDPGDDNVTQHRLGADGRVVLRNVAEASYIVAHEGAPGQWNQDRVRIDGKRGRTVTFVLSTARLHGRVLDTDGVTAAGAGLLAFRGQFDPDVVGAWTREDGTYSFDALPEGEWSVSVRLSGSVYGTPEYRRKAWVANGGTFELNFGDAQGLCTWTGTLLNRSGDPVSSYESVAIHRIAGNVLPGFADTSAENSSEYVGPLSIGADGTFEKKLEKGTYLVKSNMTGGGKSVALTNGLVVDGDVRQDLVLPGTRLIGTVTDRVTGNALAGDGNRVVRIHRRGHDYPAAFESVPVMPDGSYAIDGIDPGDWRVGVGGDGLDAMVDVVVEEDDYEVRMDLVTGG